MRDRKLIRDRVLALLKRRKRGWRVHELAQELERGDEHVRRELGDLRSMGLARCETLRVQTPQGMRPAKLWHAVVVA